MEAITGLEALAGVPEQVQTAFDPVVKGDKGQTLPSGRRRRHGPAARGSFAPKPANSVRWVSSPLACVS